MDQKQFDKIWASIKQQTLNRRKGAFMRALWYGNNNRVLGQNKGLRKGIRNAPKKLVLLPLEAVSLPLGVSGMVDAGADLLLDKAKDLYCSKFKQTNPGSAQDEVLRKKVKSSVKQMKTDGLEVLDRNLVKMKDAKAKVRPCLDGLKKALGDECEKEERRMQLAHDALCAVAEAEYYIDKTWYLVAVLERTLHDIAEDLGKLKSMVTDQHGELQTVIMAEFDGDAKI